MPGQTFLRRVGGLLQEIRGVQASTGAADADKIPALDATGRLDNSMMPVGIGAETQIAPASENLAAGDSVNLWNDSGTMRARKADGSSAGKPADGFVLAAVTSGQDATVYTDGFNTQASGLTAGQDVYLGTTAGVVTQAALTGAGQVHQRLGKALSATSYVYERGEPITLA